MQLGDKQDEINFLNTHMAELIKTHAEMKTAWGKELETYNSLLAKNPY